MTPEAGASRVESRQDDLLANAYAEASARKKAMTPGPGARPR